ncbi:Hsp20/alpha crystallin family protein [Billgrantia antri]|uniref:Hsp20/alpha crystallin family protein n=1 Tax=Halomonas sulfidivorans TaxID=2733488 RepID=A0ABX7WAZ7_9GAMM|nr:Hsp20/alpha crystallin family protein [Halomonas sulfidivorans]QTP57564.1 Hsp20/alpha crystallin family protein [Halomonas sulfidivorans]
MNEITRQQSTRQPRVQGGEDSRGERDRALQPPVDIYEEGNALHLVADLPGVTPESLSIEVDNNMLSLEAEIRLEMPERMTAIYAEVRAQRFARRFTLSHEIDGDAIEARIDKGVLHLRLPKKPSHQRRRIEVRAA